jgi:hypothetical protein
VIRAGDVLRFGPAVKATPKVDPLTVLSVNNDGPVFALPGGFVTTANGTIEMNGALQIETGIPERGRVAVRISLVR